MSGRVEHEFQQVSRAFAFQTFDTFLHVQPVAGGASERGVHVGQDGTRGHAALVAERDHRLCQLACVGFGLHEGGGAKLHVKD